MFQEKYKARYEKIVPDQRLVESTIKQINSQVKWKVHGVRPFYREIIPIAAAALFCLFMAMPVLAANMPAVYELIYRVSPATAQYFKPVQKSCEVNGVKMEVAAIYMHEDTAEIYITMQDLAGNRIDETIDLNDSYSIRRPFDSSATCERISYDQETKTASFLIRIIEFEKHTITGNKLTFSVRNFLSGKHTYEGVPIEIDLGTITDAAQNKEVTLSGYSGPGLHQEGRADGRQAGDQFKVISPSNIVFSPVAGIDITGIGYVDGLLHIQTAVTGLLQNDNHGYFFLEDRNGNKIKSAYSAGLIEYTGPGNSEGRVDYMEYVFDIPRHEIKNYRLYGSFFTSGLYTEGPWQVTFPLAESSEN